MTLVPLQREPSEGGEPVAARIVVGDVRQAGVDMQLRHIPEPRRVTTMPRLPAA